MQPPQIDTTSLFSLEYFTSQNLIKQTLTQISDLTNDMSERTLFPGENLAGISSRTRKLFDYGDTRDDGICFRMLTHKHILDHPLLQDP